MSKYIYNPKSGRNVLKTGKIGKILFQQEQNNKEILEKIHKKDFTNNEELIKLLEDYNGNIMIKNKVMGVDIKMPKHIYIDWLKDKIEYCKKTGLEMKIY
jgi:hypothetical protein